MFQTVSWIDLINFTVGIMCRNFRHEKTKKKRGSYKGGVIDHQSHSIKFANSDDEWVFIDVRFAEASVGSTTNLHGDLRVQPDPGLEIVPLYWIQKFWWWMSLPFLAKSFCSEG